MTAEVRLDRLRPADAAHLVQAMNDPDTLRWLASIPQPYGPEQAHDFITQAGPEECAIRLGDRFAGVVRGGAELGFWVMPHVRGQGVARRASVLALSRSFLAGHPRVTAQCQAANAPSRAVLTALGFADPQPGTIFVERRKREQPALRLSLSRQAFVERHACSLQTRRLVMDPIGEGDLPALYPIATDPRVAPMLLRFAPGMPMPAFRALIPPQAALPPFRLAIRHQGRLIGSVGIGEPGDAPHIFYFLTPDQWGQGLMAEALAAFLSELDARFALPALAAMVFADNPASLRLLQKNGFRVTGQTDFTSDGRRGPAPGWTLLRPLPTPS